MSDAPVLGRVKPTPTGAKAHGGIDVRPCNFVYPQDLGVIHSPPSTCGAFAFPDAPSGPGGDVYAAR